MIPLPQNRKNPNSVMTEILSQLPGDAEGRGGMEGGAAASVPDLRATATELSTRRVLYVNYVSKTLNKEEEQKELLILAWYFLDTREDIAALGPAACPRSGRLPCCVHLAPPSPTLIQQKPHQVSQTGQRHSRPSRYNGEPKGKPYLKHY